MAGGQKVLLTSYIPEIPRKVGRRTLRDYVHLFGIFIHDKALVSLEPPVYSVIPDLSYPTPPEDFRHFPGGWNRT